MEAGPLLFIWSIPVIFQAAAGAVAFSIAKRTSARIVWLMMGAAFFLMSMTTALQILQISRGVRGTIDLILLVPTLLVSIFFLGGMSKLAPLLDEIQRSNRTLRESESRYRHLLDGASEGIWLLDARLRTVYINRRMAGMLGRTPDEMLGRSLFYFISAEHRIDAERNINKYRLHNERKFDLCLRRKDGSEVWTIFSSNLLMDDHESFAGILGVVTDIQTRKEMERRILRKAQHDLLTGLPNRVLLGDRLEQAVARAQRKGGLIAVLFVDLDNFKPINDTLGHEAGDDVLRQVAARMNARIRHMDTLARYGGDEFVIVLQDLRDVGEATRFADELLELLKEPLLVAKDRCEVGASIGISIYPNDGRSGASLIREADKAMYIAKEGGKNRWSIRDVRTAKARKESWEGETGVYRGGG